MGRWILKKRLKELEDEIIELEYEIIGLEDEIMNARQAARAAAEHIVELERQNALRTQDITDYNACVLEIINGGDPCKWCEEEPECQRECKGKGCQEWWLRYRKAGDSDAEEAKEEDAATDPVLDLAGQ